LFGKIGVPEILIVLLVLLLLFGGKKLPELAKGIGDAFRELRKGIEGKSDSDKESEKK
jgi:sec-independent protein translocase protein TatA